MSSAGESHYRGDTFRIVKGASRLRGSAAERLLYVFQCYLDDSGTTGLPIVTLGGFFAHLDQWERVEPLVDAVMNSHGVDVFHAKQFHDTDTPFDGWTKVRKLSFTDEVFSAAHGAMAGVSLAVDKDGVKQGKKLFPRAFESKSPMGVSFGAIMTRILTHDSVAQAVQKQGLSFLVESGPNNGELQDYFHKMAAQPAFEGVLRSITFVPKAHCRAIQLADFFVFYSRRYLRNVFRFKGKLIIPPCPYIETMRKHGPIYQDIAGTPKALNVAVGKEIKNLSDLAALTRKRRP
jgi:hypothetical protein